MRVLSAIGTRPEAIKMAPVVKELQRTGGQSLVCVSAQHREMLDSVLQFFQIEPDIDLDLMERDQSLNRLNSRLLNSFDAVLRETEPDIVLVQGDTTTAMAAAAAAFHRRIPVGHVEAGLRSHNISAPFPEEMNRKVIDIIARHHFAPTAGAAKNIKQEMPTAESVHVTGNTAIDALLMAIARLRRDDALRQEIDEELQVLRSDRRLILVTGHRRESFGKGFEEICLALKQVADREDVEIVYPVHLNPNVRGPVRQILGNVSNIHLWNPISYPTFVRLMQRAHLILTDSGGIQEEAPALNKPVLVMRSLTERPEGVAAGATELVGTDHTLIVSRTHALLDDAALWCQMSAAPNPYGDGRAAERICRVLGGSVSNPSLTCERTPAVWGPYNQAALAVGEVDGAA